jgi:hypothetical protein
MFKGPWQQTVTRVLILTTPLIWIGWDLYSYLTAGNASTESATIFRYSVHAPGVAFLVGVLCGHLFFQMREPTAYPKAGEGRE